MSTIESIRAQLLRNSREEDGCLVWTGFRNPSGYGMLSLTERVGRRMKSKARLAHRVAYQAFCGSIEPGKNVLHRCDNRSCVKPEHLFLGSQRDNMEDRFKKNRHGRSAKLSPDDVRLIRASPESDDVLAAKFAVTSRTILGARRRETWRHL